MVVLYYCNNLILGFHQDKLSIEIQRNKRISSKMGLAVDFKTYSVPFVQFLDPNIGQICILGLAIRNPKQMLSILEYLHDSIFIFPRPPFFISTVCAKRKLVMTRNWCTENTVFAVHSIALVKSHFVESDVTIE